MSTLSIIKSENKYAFTYDGEVNEITRMLTQCALRDELLAEAIFQSALNINRQLVENLADIPVLEEQTEETE